MKGNRHKEWTALWKWFGAIDTQRPVSGENWKGLYHLLDRVWEDERKDAGMEELAAHAGAIVSICVATRPGPRVVESKTPTQ